MMYHFDRQYQKSIESFRQAQKLNPELIAPHLFAGIDYYLVGQPAAAIPELQRALQLDHGNVEARKWLGMSYMHLGDFSAAANELSQCPRDEEILFYLGRAYAKVAETAFQTAKTVEAGSPKRAELELRGATASQQALNAIDEFAVLAPQSWRADQLRAEYHLARGEEDSAIPAYEQALAKKPDAVQIHLALGNIYATRREWNQAIRQYQAELKADPYSAKALERMGQVHADLHQTAEATRYLLRAIALDPNLPDAHKALGKVYLQQSEPAQAVKHLRLALALGATSDTTVYFRLSKALRLQGEAAEAEKIEAALKKLLSEKRDQAGQHSMNPE
jgi:tetratricopeptide (TPR) repeat protein